MYQVEPIGTIRSCYTEKFGIPKQPGLVKVATARLEFNAPYDREEMVRGLEGFSHIWVIFLFHDTIDEGWKPMVRPPRLGGQKRVGLYASRSPHRPNHIGISVVRLDNVLEEKGKVFLELSGVDLLDGTPVLDIKPYIPYSDSIEGATDGFTREEIEEPEVFIPEGVVNWCQQYQDQTGKDLLVLIRETLKNDPRPASQRTIGREYGMLFWDINVRWVVEEGGFRVLGCEKIGG